MLLLFYTFPFRDIRYHVSGLQLEGSRSDGSAVSLREGSVFSTITQWGVVVA